MNDVVYIEYLKCTYIQHKRKEFFQKISWEKNDLSIYNTCKLSPFFMYMHIIMNNFSTFLSLFIDIYCCRYRSYCPIQTQQFIHSPIVVYLHKFSLELYFVFYFNNIRKVCTFVHTLKKKKNGLIILHIFNIIILYILNIINQHCRILSYSIDRDWPYWVLFHVEYGTDFYFS